jgi:hypothetical protein
VRYLNDNGDRLQSLECGDLWIDAQDNGQKVSLPGVMTCARPRNFRLQATLLGNPAVDMGSNNNEFWYWISRADPPYLVHCSYADLARGDVSLPFPFQPEWALEALGMAHYEPNGNYQLKPNAKTVELIEQTTSSQGQPVRKVTVFDRASLASGRPQVRAHLLQDAKGQLICAAQITQYQADRTTGAVFPHLITLSWPAQGLAMTMKLDSVRVNALDQNRSLALFSRPQMSHIQTVDLARWQARPTGRVQRVGNPPS